MWHCCIELHCINYPLEWRYNGLDSVSNHQSHDCLLNRLLRCRSKKTSKLRVTGLCEGNSPGTSEFPAQMASDAENVSIWWRHHAPCWALFTGRIINQVMCYSHEDKYNLTHWSPWARGVSIRPVSPGDQCVKYLRYNVIRSFQDVVLVIQDHYRSLICYMMVMDGWYITPSISDGWVMDIPSINQ